MARGAGSAGSAVNGRRVSSDREGDLVLGDSSNEMSLGEGGLREFLTQAAAERQSTLEYFRRNPSECSLEKRASQRLNRDDGDLPENNSLEAPVHQSTRAEAPAELPSEKPESVSTSLAPQQLSNWEAASATVHAERLANASAPNASASEQSKDVDERHRTVAQESPSKDTKSQSRQLLETRAELRRLQGVLKAERDAVADLTARLQDSQTECDKLQDKVTELQATQAAESQKVQKTDTDEISDELLEELEQEIDDLREKLEASESKNTMQQAEWESIKQELTAEIQELKSKLAGAQAEIDELKSKPAGSAVSAKKDQQAEDQDKDKALAGGINANAKTPDVAGLSAELSGEIQDLKRKLAGAERARKKADAESDKQLLDLKCQLEEALEMLEGTPEYDAIMEILMTVKPKSKKGAGAPAQVDVCTQATAPEKGQGEAVCAEDVLQRMLHKMCVAAALRQWSLEVLRGVRKRNEHNLPRPPTNEGVAAGGECIDLEKAQRVVDGGDSEELETFLLQAIDEIKWRRNKDNVLLRRPARGSCAARGDLHAQDDQLDGEDELVSGRAQHDGSAAVHEHRARGEFVSEGVQTISVMRNTVMGDSKGAQTAPASASCMHTQTARFQSVTVEAQTVAPEPGVVVHTQTMTAATATTGTGTGDDTAGAGMHTMEVAPGPAPAPREVAHMESDASSATTSLSGPRSAEHCETGCGTSDLIDPRELEERLREAIEFVEGVQWCEWRIKLERGGRELVSAAASAQLIEETLGMALNVLGHLSREVADIGADRDLAVRRQEEVAVAREEGAREIEKVLHAVEEQLQTVEVDCGCFQSQVSELKNMLAHKDSLLVQKDKLIQTMEHERELGMDSMRSDKSNSGQEQGQGGAGSTSSPTYEAVGESIDLKKAERAVDGGDPEELETFLLQAIDEIKWRRKGGGVGQDAVLNPFEAQQEELVKKAAGAATTRTLDLLDLFDSAPPEQQRPTPPQPATDLLDDLFGPAVTPVAVASAVVTPAPEPAGAARAAGRQVNPFADNPFAEEEEDMQSTSGREREMAARIELLEEKLAEAVEESAKRGEELDALYDEHKLDLSKASAAIAAAEDAARHVKGVRSETLVAELVQLRAEIRRLRLKSEEGDEDAEEEAESLGGVAATSRSRSVVENQPEENQTSRQRVDKVQQQLTELCNKSVHADDEMEDLLSRQREAEEREKALLHERAALQTQLEELQAQVEEANKQVAMTVKSGHEKALALEKTQNECDALRQECQRLSATCNNHANCMPNEKSATPTPPEIQEANGTLGRGAHPARVASGGEMGADGKMCARAEGGLDGAKVAEDVEGFDMDGLENVQELREQLHKAQEELEEERKRNKGQDSGGEGGEEELEELRRRLDEERKKMMDLEEELQKAQANLAKQKAKADELSKQNSQVVHKLQTALTKKRDAESECAQAVAEATRQAGLATGAHCEARGLKAELVVLRQHFESLQERFNSSILSSPASPQKPFLGATSSPIQESEGVECIDLKKAERATYGGDPEEMETFLLQAIDEIKWRRKGGGGGAAEASVVSDTAAIRAEVLEIEVDNLTKEIVEERAIKAAAVHRCRIMYEDASRCAAEIGDLIQGFSIGLQSILSESEEDTSAVLKEHKKLLKQFHESEQARHAAEVALASMKKQSQGKATHFGVFGSTSLPEKDVKKLRDELAETKAQWKELQVKYEALGEETRLNEAASQSSLDMLTDLLQEKKDELERWASVCVCEAAQQRVTTADTRKQPPPSTLPRAKVSSSPKQHLENIKGKLQVKCGRADGLPKMDMMSSKADPYLVLTVDQVAQRTSSKKKTLEPVWDETLSFECQAGLSVLHVEMFDQETLGKDRSMGSFCIPVTTEGFKNKAFALNGRLFDKRPAAGSVYLSISFEPSFELPFPPQRTLSQGSEEEEEAKPEKVSDSKENTADANTATGKEMLAMRKQKVPNIEHSREKEEEEATAEKVSDWEEKIAADSKPLSVKEMIARRKQKLQDIEHSREKEEEAKADKVSKSEVKNEADSKPPSAKEMLARRKQKSQDIEHSRGKEHPGGEAVKEKRGSSSAFPAAGAMAAGGTTGAAGSASSNDQDEDDLM